jgi:hypothetical protein
MSVLSTAAGCFILKSVSHKNGPGVNRGGWRICL